jgi:hypothetical protein
MVTIVIKPIAIAEYKKKPHKIGFQMHCYFDEFLFKDWKQIFVSIQEASHYAEGFLLESFIEPGCVYTIIEKYVNSKDVSIEGLPYGTHYKSKKKYVLIPNE